MVSVNENHYIDDADALNDNTSVIDFLLLGEIIITNFSTSVGHMEVRGFALEDNTEIHMLDAINFWSWLTLNLIKKAQVYQLYNMYMYISVCLCACVCVNYGIQEIC